eukprot:1237347-Rhodomonas_salina.1
MSSECAAFPCPDLARSGVVSSAERSRFGLAGESNVDMDGVCTLCVERCGTCLDMGNPWKEPDAISLDSDSDSGFWYKCHKAR